MAENLNIGSMDVKLTADSTQFNKGMDAAAQKATATERAVSGAAKRQADAQAFAAKFAADQVTTHSAKMVAAQNRVSQASRDYARAQAIARSGLLGEGEAAKVAAAAYQRLAAAQKAAKSTKGGIFETLGLGGLIGGIGVVGTLTAITTALAEMTSKSVDLGVELGHLSQKTGISAENLSVLKYASDQSGVGIEALTKGFKKLSTELDGYNNGSKSAKAAFDELGISQTQLKETSGDLWKVLGLVADRFAEMPDGYKKNAEASKLFGKAGTDLIPMLNGGSEAMEKYKAEATALGIVLDEKGIAKMEELHHKSIELHAAMDGLGLSIVTSLAPGLERAASAMERLIQYSKKEVFSVGDSGLTDEQWKAGMSGKSYKEIMAMKPAAAPVVPAVKPTASDFTGGGEGSGRSKENQVKVVVIPEADFVRLAREAALAMLPAHKQALGMDGLTPMTSELSDLITQPVGQGALPRMTSALPSWVSQTPAGPEANRFGELRGVMDSLREFTSEVTNAGHVMAQFAGETMTTVNGQLTKAMTGQKTDWRGAGFSLASSASSAGLKMAEGSLLKMAGLGGSKADGTKTMPFYTIVMGGGGAGGKDVSGLMGWFAKMGKANGHAMGGGVSAGSIAMVGEQGPELVRFGSDAYVTPNHKLPDMIGGGGTAVHYHIDARNSDAAMVDQRVRIAMQATHATAVRDAVMAGADRARRMPRG